jgi:hypothetical protein
LSPEDQKYYETYFDLFIHPGWKQFQEEIQDILNKYRIEEIKDERHLAFVKGERDALFRIRRFESAMKRAYEVNTND